MERQIETSEVLPENKQLIVLLGPPGGGKSFCGEILAERFGYYVYDLDSDFNDELKDARRKSRPFTVDMRRRFLRAMFDKIAGMQRQHSKLIVEYAFVNDILRIEFFEAFPHSNFILVDASSEERVARIHSRGSHAVSVEQAIRSGDTYEPLTIPHKVLLNQGDRDIVTAKIQAILSVIEQGEKEDAATK